MDLLYEKQCFIEAQQRTIEALIRREAEMLREIEHLKSLLLTNQPNKVEQVIITPEEALIETQIQYLQQNGLERELSLDSIKKLDLLIKNKKVLKDQQTTLKVESKQLGITSNDLLMLVKTIPHGPKSE